MNIAMSNLTREEIRRYSVNELHGFLLEKLEGKVDSVDSIALKFKENKITGSIFLDLTFDDLREILPLIGERKVVKSIVDSFATSVVGSVRYLGVSDHVLLIPDFKAWRNCVTVSRKFILDLQI